MKKISLIIAAVASLTASMAAHADFNGKITAVQADNGDNGNYIGFKIAPATGVTLPSCASGTYANGYIYVGAGDATANPGDLGRNIAADAVLAAYNGAKNVRFIVPGSTCDSSGRLYVQGIHIQ